MLAVVYETFTSIERDKFRKLLLHKRQACKNAFKLLLTKENPNQMEFTQFEGVMRYYAPKKSNFHNYLWNKKIYLIYYLYYNFRQPRFIGDV
jgi:two pore calcium channel protein 1